jgi:hypothetical protein
VRDSTGSSFQHWGVALGVKSPYHAALNLDGNRWYDIYTTVIELFLRENERFLSEAGIGNLLNRKFLKKIIMTVNYNAGRKRCLEVLHSTLREEGLFDEGLTPLYVDFINSFHTYLVKDLFYELYSSDKNAFLRQHSSLLVLRDSRINLSYYYTKDVKEVVKVKQDRWVYTAKALQTEVWDWRTKTALNANIIQAKDAELAREIVSRCDCWPVHDSFAVGLFDVGSLMDATNDYFSRSLGSETYSVFVLI